MHVLFYEMEGVLTRERRLLCLNPQHLWPCTSSLDLYSLLLRMPINPSTSFLALGDGEGTRRMKKKVVVRVVDIHRMNRHHAYVVHYGLDWVLYPCSYSYLGWESGSHARFRVCKTNLFGCTFASTS
jgi:hypothetical protein